MAAPLSDNNINSIYRLAAQGPSTGASTFSKDLRNRAALPWSPPSAMAMNQAHRQRERFPNSTVVSIFLFVT